MVYKACIYKGCENYTHDSVPCGHKQFTIFRFPKDPTRYEQWMKRGRVPDGLPESHMLMCSDHFDDKYIIKNSRRTMLTTSALPFPYCDANSDIECCDYNIDNEVGDSIAKVDGTLDAEMVFSIQGDLSDGSALIRLKESLCDGDDEDGMLEFEKVDNNSNTEYCVESTTMKEKTDMELADVVSEYEDDETDLEDDLLTEMVTQSATKESTFKATKIHATKKRKITDSDVDEIQEPTSSKMLISKMPTLTVKQRDSSGTTTKHIIQMTNGEDDNKQQRLSNKKQYTLQSESDKIDPETLVDAKAVTSFIFKGEEYVQMPKEYYIQEKLELIEKMRKYENMLRLFKKNLNNLELQ